MEFASETVICQVVRDAVTGAGRPPFSKQVLWLALVLLLICCAHVPCSWALQRHTLLPSQTPSSEPQAAAERSHPVEPAVSSAAQQQTPVASEPGHPVGQAAEPGPQHPAPQAVPEQPAKPSTGAPQLPAAKPEKKEAHPPAKDLVHGPEAGPAVHEEHGVKLPEISPIAGVTFVETIIKLMDYELNGRFLGWRPNDIIIGRFTDNVNSYQLGVLEAIRFTMLRLKDSLTRMGDADAYDRDLEHALNLFMNRATLFWFPSAETSYNEALAHLKNFRHKLETGQRSFYYRVDNLRSLITIYKDLLGNVNRSLIMATHADGSPVSWFEIDDYFYYAKGTAHVIFETLKVVRVGFKAPLATLRADEMMDEVLHELYRVEEMDPWLILNSDLDGFFANHRANINAPLSEVAHLLGVMSQL